MSTDHGLYWTHGLHRALQQQPDGVATIFGDRTRTFEQQASRVARLAGALREHGVRDGSRVGILGLSSDRYAEALLATAWADGIFNVIDCLRAPFEIGPMLADTGTRILLVDDVFTPFVPEVQRAWPGLRTVIHMGDGPTPEGMVGYEDLIATGPAVPDARRDSDAVAGLLHTGGTTDAPKAVMHTARSLITLVTSLGVSMPGFVEPGTRLLQITPMSHVSGVGACLTMSQFGRTMVPLAKFDPRAVLEAIEKHRVTAMFIVPPMLQQVVDHPAAQRYDLTSVRTILYGASPVTEPVLERVSARFPAAGLGQIYAMTEAMTLTMLTPEQHRPGRQRRSAGRSVLHTELRVVDAADRDLPTGELGEVLLRGPSLMEGYWEDPQATAHVLRGGWMHTGDVGQLDEDGFLYLVDRLKDVVVVNGDNVHSTEVENALASHPDVVACAVIGVPDDTTGERVHAVVVLRPGAEPDDEQLRKHSTSLVADFKAPRSWEYVDALPMSPNGKVLKRELRRPHWEGQERQVG